MEKVGRCPQAPSQNPRIPLMKLSHWQSSSRYGAPKGEDRVGQHIMMSFEEMNTVTTAILNEWVM